MNTTYNTWTVPITGLVSCSCNWNLLKTLENGWIRSMKTTYCYFCQNFLQQIQNFADSAKPNKCNNIHKARSNGCKVWDAINSSRCYALLLDKPKPIYICCVFWPAKSWSKHFYGRFWIFFQTSSCAFIFQKK